jgi:TetR/AcrR family transcriptional repressor of nem operon
MKVSREQAAKNRERILETAARLFRERGFDGIGVADLMKAAGLTHGGFYGHFKSKEELMALASERALAESNENWTRAAAEGEAALGRMVQNYLSPRHRDAPGRGCVVAALATDAARQPMPVRQALTQGVRHHVESLEAMVPGKTRAAKREKALAVYAGMVGALALARAVDDEVLSEALLKAAARGLTGAN